MSERDPHDVAWYDDHLDRHVVGGAQRLTQPIEIREYDSEWPRLYARAEARIRSVLGERVVRIEYVGSTAVPGLPAKPIVDIVLDRELYARTKRELAAHDWKYVQQFAHAKTAVVQEIVERARVQR